MLWDYILRIAVAALLGGAIGLESFQKMQHEIDGDRSHCLPQPRPAF